MAASSRPRGMLRPGWTGTGGCPLRPSSIGMVQPLAQAFPQVVRPPINAFPQFGWQLAEAFVQVGFATVGFATAGWRSSFSDASETSDVFAEEDVEERQSAEDGHGARQAGVESFHCRYFTPRVGGCDRGDLGTSSRTPRSGGAGASVQGGGVTFWTGPGRRGIRAGRIRPGWGEAGLARKRREALPLSADGR